ncbi:MAG: hypothetical protein V1744_06120 [Candidatus Altiarchaeota archaeon]
MTQGRAKGQASVELISYLGLFMLALAAALIYFYPDWETKNRFSTAEVTVSDIRQTTDNVYTSGPGRRETITIRVPSGVSGTQASDNRILMRLQLPGGGTSDALEVTKAPLKGYIPTQEGTHQLTIEYMNSGFVVLGSGLSIEPSFTELKTTPDNRTNFTVTVSNSADRTISAINVSVSGQESWFTLNETGFSLNKGEDKALLIQVTTPGMILPITYTNYLKAESADAYAEATVNVIVEGVVCGDTVKELLESCETRTPFTFPDNNNPYCPNPGGGGGSVQCDATNTRYKAYDQHGQCLSDCTCTQDTPEWVTCGSGCVDPQYCNNCPHCFDGAQNCGETIIDGGGACPICDGTDDILEGFQCSLGQTRQCGGPECSGTQTCERIGTAGCGWGVCSTSGQHCQNGVKCCTCAGDPTNPVKTFNATWAPTDCAGNVTTCGFPTTCQAGTYTQICTGLDACSANLSDIRASNISGCVGQTCGEAQNQCYDNVYPCHGSQTTFTCSMEGSCQSTTQENLLACGSESSCLPPQALILHKLDINDPSDYVDAPKSYASVPGFYFNWPAICTDANFKITTYTQMYHTDPGAYAPYMNGTLYLYGKGYHIYNQFYHDDCHWTQCQHNSDGIKRSYIRIGTNASNYLEYTSPVWKPEWQRGSINLENPARKRGTVNWSDIRYLQFGYVVNRECQSTDSGCGYCHMWLDSVTLER